METENKNTLIALESLNPIEVYNPGNIDTVLEKIFSEVKSQKTDISTDKGRKEIASLAYKVSRSKTFLDDLGKKLGEEAKAKLDAINSERKKVRDRLDTLKDEVRKPLTDWEDAEKNRVLAHETGLSKIIELGQMAENHWHNHSKEELADFLGSIKALNQTDWQEFQARATLASTEAASKVEASIVKRSKWEAEQAELARLRAAEAERIQKERDEKIARDAAEKAKRDAEEVAKKQAEDVERRERAAAREKAELEQRLQESERKAKRDQEAAVERERLRIENERLEAQKAEEQRERNKKHAAKINGEVLKALISESAISEEVGKIIVAKIAMGKIPHTKISY